MRAQAKEESWWLVAGDASSDELLALKRVALSHKTSATLDIPRASLTGAPLKGVMLQLVSGCYVGLDQQAWVPTASAAVQAALPMAS